MPYKLERFKLEHLEKLEPREEMIEEIDFLKKDKNAQDCYMHQGVTNTLMYNDTPILIVSMANLGFGTYMPLMASSKYVSQHKFAVIKFIYKCFDDYVGPDVRRLEVLVDAEDKTALRFVKFYGFDIIGIKHCSSVSGRDQIILERMYRKSW